MTTTPAPVALKDPPPRRKPPRLPPSNAAALAALRAGDKKPPADPSRKESQDKVGNGAVAAGLARGPAADPKFAVLKKDVAHKKHTIARSHPPASQEATSAQDASVPPKDDEVAQGKTANAEKMNEAKPKEFDKEAFVKAVEKAIAEKAPKNLEQADEFADSGKPAEVKAEVQGKVGEGKTDSAEQIADTTAAPPDTSAAETKQVVPLAADRPPGTPATPDPAKATPDKLPPAATDLSAGPADVNREMAENQVTEQQLQKSNEPAFGSALKEKKTAEKHSEVTPPELRKNEAQQLRQATAQAKGLGAAAMGGIAERRRRTGRLVDGGKNATKTTDQDKRAEVTAILQKVFDTMKAEVEGILTGLDKLVDDQFTRGEKEARDAFTAEHRQKMDEYKAKRYGGRWGLIKWGHDKLFGLPAEADLIFVVARDHYVKRMRGVISAVADTIGRELTRAKQRIAKGRDELQAEVKKLPKDLQALGKQAAAGFADKFDELTQSVDDKSTELVDTLATKYTDAVKAVDDEIAAEKEKNKGLVDKALDGIKGVIKTIMELKDLLLGVLAKAAQAVMGILRDPIGFLGNLVSAVGGGLKLFMQNAGRHLQQGVLSWLLGTAATAGITLPTSFDVMGILLLIASLIGLSWANLRTRLARKLPKEAMTAIEVGEHALPLVLEVRKRGIRALWDDLKARVGDLKKNLIDNLVSYLLPTIIIAGVTWIISLFNPASAFIRACKMIIDIIRFIVTNGKQIIEFVNTVLDAVIAIAKGGSGGVPALVEKALARSIPVLIGALAALLGIGGIASKVKEIFQKLAKPVNKAIDWVVDKIVGLAKKVWAKVKALAKKAADKFGKKPKDGKPRKPLKDRIKEKVFGGDDSPEGQKKRLQKGLNAARSAAKRVKRTGRVMEKILRGVFTVIRVRYRMTLLEPVLENGRWKAHGAVNPEGYIDLGVDAPPAGPLTQKDEEYIKEIEAHLPSHGGRFAREAREQWNQDLEGKAVGGTPIWDATPLPLEPMPADGIALLKDHGVHRLLLPYFRERSRTGGATSERFYEHAFGLPAIRGRLLAILGAAALTELRLPRSTRSAEVNKQLTDMKYHASIGKWGEFAPIPGAGAGVDAELKAAVQAAGGIIPFLKDVAHHQGQWETKIFDLWNHDPPSKEFLMDRFRGADSGMHEWIPTDYIPKVLKRAMERRSTEGALEGVRWVVLQHALRSPTRYVIWKLDGATPQGHSGVFWQSYQDGGKTKHKFTLTDGQDKFHDDLRRLFDGYGGKALGYPPHLRGKLPTIMWTGELDHTHEPFLATQVSALVKTATGLASMRLEELSDLQKANFKAIKADFYDAEDAVGKET
ncbi:phage tail protein [Amycolatopsis kentuckyensis]|uniref:phage tail protein n=1 Tax=Amycolatopsis kentuckyensis TaxID=218823 RepID=UPI0035697F63